MIVVVVFDSTEIDRMVADSSLPDRAAMAVDPRVLYYRPESAADARVVPGQVVGPPAVVHKVAVGSRCTSLQHGVNVSANYDEIRLVYNTLRYN